MARRYETVYIVDSTLEEPAINEKLERFHALLGPGGQAPEVTVNHWGKRTLTHAIKNRDTGYYVVAQFEVEPTVLPEYERAVKLDDQVLRFLVVVADAPPPPPEEPGSAEGEEPAEGAGAGAAEGASA